MNQVAGQNLSDVMAVTMEKIKDIIDVNTIVGTPITTPEGLMLIPISKVSFGFASGGSDFDGKNSTDPIKFGGGSGAVATIVPIAFLIINGESVKLLPVASPANTTVDRVVEVIPDVLDRVDGFFEKRKKTKDA